MWCTFGFLYGFTEVNHKSLLPIGKVWCHRSYIITSIQHAIGVGVWGGRGTSNCDPHPRLYLKPWEMERLNWDKLHNQVVYMQQHVIKMDIFTPIFSSPDSLDLTQVILPLPQLNILGVRVYFALSLLKLSFPIISTLSRARKGAV